MKKIFAIILLGVFMVSLSSAGWDWDNTYDYNSEHDTVIIENRFGLGADLAYLKLTWGDTTVARGIDQHVGTFTIQVTESGYDETIFDALDLENLKNGQVMTRGKQYKVKTYKNISVDDFETTCEDVWNATSSNYSSECITEEIGKHWEVKEEWTPISNPNFEFEVGIEYEVGVFVDVEEGDYGDWIPSLMGVEIVEWATWSENLNADLNVYYAYEDNLASIIVTDGPGVLNGVSGRNTNVFSTASGRVNRGFDFDGTNDFVNTTGFSHVGTEGTLSFWFNADTTVNKQLIDTGHGANGINCQVFDNDIYCFVGDDGWMTEDIISSTWYNIIVTWDGSNQYMYVNNGTGIGASGGTDTPPTTPTTLYVAETAGGLSRFNGVMDEVSIWNRVLTTSEISDVSEGITYSSGISPSVILVSPANNSNLTSPNIDFITTVTDDIQVLNVTLYIDGVANQTNSSGFNGTYTFTVMGLGDGIYNWSILAYDNSSLSNQSETRTFNLTIPPIFIDLLSPADSSTHNIPLVNMSCKAYKDVGVTQLNLTIDGVTNISITNTSIAENLTISQDVNFSEGNYTWGCSAINPSTSAVSSNRTFEVLYSNPVINLFEPANDSDVLIENITFIFNASDVNGIDNVTLYIDGVLNETNSSGIEGNYSFFRTLTDGFYNWSVTATSTLGKITNSATRFFTLHTEIPVVNITAPSGVINYFKLGDNETLIYNISEEGEDVSHFDECWFVYPSNIDSSCYQESANTTNQTGIDGNCNLNYNGSYELDDGAVTWFYTDNRVIDGLFSTFNFANNYGDAYLDVNYTKPAGANNESIWMVKMANTIYNDTIPSDCWNAYSDIIILRVISHSDPVLGGGYARSQCYDGSIYTTIRTDTANEKVYEEAMYWETKTELNCSANTTNFTYINGQNSITVFAKDDFGFIANDTSTWEYKILEINQTYVNETVEGSTQDISALIKLASGLTISAAILNYNGTLFAGTSSISGENILILESGLVTPNVEAEENLTFKWSIVLSGGETINLSEQTQTVTNIGMDNCSTFTNKILNITMVDEELQTLLSNTTLEIAINIFSSDRSTEVVDFSDEFKNDNPIEICINLNISDVSYSLDSIIRYIATGYANEYYNIVDYTLDNNSQTQNLTLYDLNSNDSTDFQLTFTGEDYLPVENALVLVERQYISENVFKTVEIPKTDSNGQTILHLVRNDIIYNIVVMKDGVILGNFANVIAFCDDFTIGDCSLPLNAISNVSLVFDYNDEIGLIYEENTQYNETTGIASFSFASTDGTTKIVVMNIERRDVFGNRTICTNTLVSSSGTISCQVDPAITDTTLASIILVDGQAKIYSEVTIDSTAYGQNGYAMFFIFAVGIFLMFSGSKTWTLVGVALEYIIGVSLGLIIGGVAGAGSTGIFVLIISMVGIWQLNKGRKQ